MSEFEKKRTILNRKLADLKQQIFNCLSSFYDNDIHSFQKFTQNIIHTLKMETDIFSEIDLPLRFVIALENVRKSKKKEKIIEMFEQIDLYENKRFKSDYNIIRKILNFIRLNKSYPQNVALKTLGMESDQLSYYTSLLKKFSTEGEYLFKKEYINNKIKQLILSNERVFKDTFLSVDTDETLLQDKIEVFKSLREKYKHDSLKLILPNLVINEGLTFLEAITFLRQMNIEPYHEKIEEILGISENVQFISMEDILPEYEELYCKSCGLMLHRSLLNLLKEQDEVVCPGCGTIIRKIIG